MIPRQPRVGKIFPWTSNPYGRCVKTAIGIYGDQLTGRTSETRDVKGTVGASGVALLAFVRGVFIDFPAYYESIRELPLTENVVHARYHKMYYKNTAPREWRGYRSNEHPLNDPKLQPLVPGIERILSRGMPVTWEELQRELGELV